LTAHSFKLCIGGETGHSGPRRPAPKRSGSHAGDDRRDFYLLKILDPGDVDKTDRSALEGPDRNLYGWVTAERLQPR